MEIKEIIQKLVLGNKLTKEEAKQCMESIIKGELKDSQITAIIMALKLRGEDKEEVLGFVEAMRNEADKLALDDYTIDTCGTGGDGKGTFNISTLVSIISAAGGVKVAKHGNGSVSSKSGSADVLSALGYNIDLPKADAEKSIAEKGFAFIFAPKYNQSMKNVANIRKELGVRTVFNLMGPLIHPGDIKGQMVGIYDVNLMPLYIEVLKLVGRERAMVVHGNDGLDEISISTTTNVYELKDGVITNYILDPKDYGFDYQPEDAIKGGTPEENKEIMFQILKGEKSAKRDIVILNSAAALYVGKVVDSYEEGIKKAIEIIDSGLGLKKLEEILEYNKGMIV